MSTGIYDPDRVSLSWSGEYIFASYVIASVGSASALQIMKQRTGASGWRNWLALLVGSAYLSGVGIFTMHFTGMMALSLHDSTGAQLRMGFHAGYTILSLIVALVIIAAGFVLAGTDPAEVRWWRTLVVGIVGGGGVSAMHYIGMTAMVSRARITWNIGIIAASVIVGVAACTAALVIFFHFGHIWQKAIWVQVATAMVMGVAVCGMHYTGMSAADWQDTHQEPDLRSYSDPRTLFITVVTLAMAACGGMLSVLSWRYRRSLLAEHAKSLCLTLGVVCRDSSGTRFLTTHTGMFPSAVIEQRYLGVGAFDGRNVDFLRMLKLSFHWQQSGHYLARLHQLHTDGSLSTYGLKLCQAFLQAGERLSNDLGLEIGQLNFAYYEPVGSMVLLVLESADSARQRLLESRGFAFRDADTCTPQHLLLSHMPGRMSSITAWLAHLDTYRCQVEMPLVRPLNDVGLAEVLTTVAESLRIPKANIESEVSTWRATLGRYVVTRTHLSRLVQSVSNWSSVPLDPMVRTAIERSVRQDVLALRMADTQEEARLKMLADAGALVVHVNADGLMQLVDRHITTPPPAISSNSPMAITPRTLQLVSNGQNRGNETSAAEFPRPLPVSKPISMLARERRSTMTTVESGQSIASLLSNPKSTNTPYSDQLGVVTPPVAVDPHGTLPLSPPMSAQLLVSSNPIDQTFELTPMPVEVTVRVSPGKPSAGTAAPPPSQSMMRRMSPQATSMPSPDPPPSLAVRPSSIRTNQIGRLDGASIPQSPLVRCFTDSLYCALLMVCVSGGSARVVLPKQGSWNMLPMLKLSGSYPEVNSDDLELVRTAAMVQEGVTPSGTNSNLRLPQHLHSLHQELSRCLRSFSAMVREGEVGLRLSFGHLWISPVALSRDMTVLCFVVRDMRSRLLVPHLASLSHIYLMPLQVFEIIHYARNGSASANQWLQKAMKHDAHQNCNDLVIPITNGVNLDSTALTIGTAGDTSDAPWIDGHNRHRRRDPSLPAGPTHSVVSAFTAVNGLGLSCPTVGAHGDVPGPPSPSVRKTNDIGHGKNLMASGRVADGTNLVGIGTVPSAIRHHSMIGISDSFFDYELMGVIPIAREPSPVAHVESESVLEHDKFLAAKLPNEGGQEAEGTQII